VPSESFGDIGPCSAIPAGREYGAIDAAGIGGYASSMSLLVDWNGKDLPDQLKELPAGRYIVEPVDDVPALSPADEDGLLRAADSVQRGGGVPAADARRRLEDRLRR
jgi:hypothetical protein